VEDRLVRLNTWLNGHRLALWLIALYLVLVVAALWLGPVQAVSGPAG
jgi:hypothetical protein